MDLRFATSFADTKTCNVDGVTGGKLLVPGQPASSQISVRPHATDAKRMPPLATSVVDTAGTGVIDAWITGVAACP
jgi:hypothetical protein